MHRMGCWLLVGLLGVCGVARAATSSVLDTARGSARLVSDTDRYAPGTVLHVGLALTLAPGWHAYWRDPGDAGAAPEVALSLPAGVSAGGIAWPVPRRIADQGVVSFGYTGSVLLARAVRVGAGVAGPVTIAAHADWLVCATICVPQSGDFSLVLQPGAPGGSAEAGLFAGAVMPVPSPWPAHIAADGTLWLEGVPAGMGNGVFLPDAADTTDLDAPQRVTRRDGRLELHLTPRAAFRAGQAMDGVLLVGGAGYAVVATPGALPAAVGGMTLALLGAGMLGGLLLNLMPCVFPVLAMKAVGIARLGGAARARVRALALSYSAGVMATFVALGVVLLVLRAAGAAAGWGFQFRYPGFVAVMAWLVFAIGLGLSGAIRIGGGLMGVGQDAAARGGHAGSFATGLLAVLVATPCTAPFMGGAVAAAASAPAVDALLLFGAMGLGFAAPTLVLTAAPGIAGRLPRPGVWMERVQQGLAFPMYAACVWLVWVLSRESGSAGLLGVGAGFVLIALAVWLVGLGGRATRAMALACGLAMAALLPGIARGPAAAGDGVAANAYSPARLAALRAGHRAVLVNMTAAWCVTCLVNERAAIRPALPGLAAGGVAYLTGDWTNQDPAISDFLRRYGRDGVPLYVFFPADATQPGRVLPQILTARMLTGLAG